MIPLLVVSSFFVPGVICLLGYDCGGTTFNLTSVSLLDVGECRNTDNDRPNATATYIQLLQVAEYSQTRVFSCRVEIDRQVFHCGMHSHLSLVDGGHRKYFAELDQAACTRLHNTRTFVYGQGTVLTDLRPNITNDRTVYLAGAVIGGDCHRTQFSDAYGTWQNVIVEATMYIVFKEYQASVKVDKDLILLRSGARCRASELSCLDDDGANVFWSPLPDDKCHFHAYDVLYQGFANRIVNHESRYPIVYSFTSDKVTFALAKKSERFVCGYTIIQTEHPKMVIVETSRDNPFSNQKPISVENLDTFLYFNSKIVYFEKHVKAQMQTLYRNVINQKCNLERQVLKNAIASAFSQPDLFAYNLMKGPGYIATIAGEVAHVIKCVPVDVTRRPTDTCYLELPVFFSNESMFLTPKTHILRKTGTPVDCNPLLPNTYNLKGGWVALTPKPAAVLPPQTLEPLVMPTWKYVDAEHLADSGIYTAEDLTRLREHIMFPIEQPSLINSFAKAATGHRVPASGISLTHLLDDDTLDLITQSAAERLFGGFLKFGTFTAGLIGIWMVVKIIKIVADTIIHGYALHSIYGWSVHLLGAIFSSITSLLLHLGRPPAGNSPARSPQTNQDDSKAKPDSTIEITGPSDLELPMPLPRSSPPVDTLYPHIQPELATLGKSLSNLTKLCSQLPPPEPRGGGNHRSRNFKNIGKINAAVGSRNSPRCSFLRVGVLRPEIIETSLEGGDTEFFPMNPFPSRSLTLTFYKPLFPIFNFLTLVCRRRHTGAVSRRISILHPALSPCDHASPTANRLNRDVILRSATSPSAGPKSASARMLTIVRTMPRREQEHGSTMASIPQSITLFGASAAIARQILLLIH